MESSLALPLSFIRQYWYYVAVFLLIWNCIVYLIYADDKRRAICKEWRISESKLLAFAFWGGSIGAIMACQITRHKTRKKSFANRLFMMALFQMIFLGGTIGFIIVNALKIAS